MSFLAETPADSPPQHSPPLVHTDLLYPPPLPSLLHFHSQPADAQISDAVIQDVCFFFPDILIVNRHVYRIP